MVSRRLQIPGGMQDTLPEECRAKRALESRLRGMFTSWGYREIETPILEYYDALDDAVWGYRPEHVWKTFDTEGRILAIRPDTTIPAARLAGSKLRNVSLPLRLCYLQSACKMERDTQSLLSEQTQAGVELMGSASREADMEILGLAVKSLQTAGIERVQLEIGHAGYLNAIVREAGLSRDTQSRLLEWIGQKNVPEMERFLQSENVSPEVCSCLLALPALFGGEEVFERARALSHSSEAQEAVDALEALYRWLHAAYPDLDLSVDMALEQEAGYYSGLIFQAQTTDVGQPILSGGRYDHLPERYGRPLPAVGFAMSLKLALIALEKQGRFQDRMQKGVGIAFDEAGFAAAYRLAEQLRQTGETAMLLHGCTREALADALTHGRYVRGYYVDSRGIWPVEGGD